MQKAVAASEEVVVLKCSGVKVKTFILLFVITTAGSLATESKTVAIILHNHNRF